MTVTTETEVEDVIQALIGGATKSGFKTSEFAGSIAASIVSSLIALVAVVQPDAINLTSTQQATLLGGVATVVGIVWAWFAKTRVGVKTQALALAGNADLHKYLATKPGAAIEDVATQLVLSPQVDTLAHGKLDAIKTLLETELGNIKALVSKPFPVIQTAGGVVGGFSGGGGGGNGASTVSVPAPEPAPFDQGPETPTPPAAPPIPPAAPGSADPTAT
jgi:hypothetical protein